MNDIKTLIDSKLKDVTVLLNDTRSLIENTRDEVVSTLRNEVNQLREEISALKDEVTELKQSKADLTTKYEELENDVFFLKADRQKLLHNAVAELEERQRRSLNVMISGTPESISESAEERKLHDLNAAKQIFRTLGQSSDSDIHEVRRMGRVNVEGKRLLRVRCENADIRAKILRNASELRHQAKFRGVFVNQDRTPSQQGEYKALRSELLSRRRRGEDVKIHGGRIISRNRIISNGDKNF